MMLISTHLKKKKEKNLTAHSKPCRGPKSYPDSQSEAWPTNAALIHFVGRESKLTMLLRESLGNVNCRTTMIAHISAAAGNYAETLSTIQIASRVLRMKKKKTKVRGLPGAWRMKQLSEPCPGTESERV